MTQGQIEKNGGEKLNKHEYRETKTDRQKDRYRFYFKFKFRRCTEKSLEKI